MSTSEAPSITHAISYPVFKVREVEVAYDRLCTICGNGLTLEELHRGRCKKYDLPFIEPKWLVELEKFQKFFRRAFGSEMRTVQRSWAKKLILGFSFGITAPTGTGKTVFGLMTALRYANSLVIFPTKALVTQAKKIIDKALDNLKSNLRVLYYHGDLKKSEKQETLKAIEEDKYDVLVITNQFLVSHFQLIANRRFSFIFIDDLDSIAKSSRNIDKVLRLLGFSNSDIWRAKNLYNVNNYEFPKPQGQLIISSATLKKGENTRVFTRLLGFDVGTSQNYLRKVYDVSVGEKNLDKLVELIHRLGSGWLLYTESLEDALQLEKELTERGFKVKSVTSKSSKAIPEFERGELDGLIGVATSYGILVRGIDMPLRIRYVIFWGLPKRAIDLEDLDKYAGSYPIMRWLGRLFLGKLKPDLEDLKKAINEHPEGVISTFIYKDKNR